MECPRCKDAVNVELSVTCPKCGLDVSLLKSSADLAQDVDYSTRMLDRLKAKIANFEVQIKRSLSQQTTSVEQAKPVPEKGTLPKTPPRKLEETAPPIKAAPQLKQRPVDGAREIQLGQKWLLIVGIVVMLLGIGFFLKYSFDKNWVGPAARVAMAYLAGLALLGTGEIFRRKKLERFGLYLIGGGIAALYFATFAAFQIYQLMAQPIAFGVMVLITALAGILSLAYNTKWLAVLGIIGGFLTPVILSTGVDNQIALMTYMAILNFGILGIAFFKRWGLLNYLGAGATWILFSAWYLEHYHVEKFWATIVFANLFFLIYTIAPFVFYIFKSGKEELKGFFITIPNTLLGFGYSFALVQDYFRLQAVAVVSVAYALVNLALAQLVWRKNKEQVEAFVWLLAKANLFLVLTVPVLFSKHWITIFWVLQAVALLWMSVKLKSTRLCFGAMVLACITTAKFFAWDLAEVFGLQFSIAYSPEYFHMFAERWLTAALVLTGLGLFGRWLCLPGWAGVYERLGKLFLSFFGMALFVVLNIEVMAFFDYYSYFAKSAAVSVLWGLFALGLILLGFAKKQSALRKTAIILFIITLVKIFVKDMSSVSTPFRIVSFLVLGLLLVGASFLYYRFQERLLSSGKEAKKEP